MPASKHKGKRKGFRIKLVHLEALLILIIYNIVSKTNFVKALTIDSLLTSFLRVYAFGIISSFIFLYIFSHEDFFPFAKDIEKEEDKKEKKYLKNLTIMGKF